MYFSNSISYSNINPQALEEGKGSDDDLDVLTRKKQVNKTINREYLPVIKKVIFNEPATIVFWSDQTKTVVKAENDTFDPEKGLAMAIAKKALGNQGNYYNTFKKWLPKEPEMDIGAMFSDIVKACKGMNFNDLSSVFTLKGETKKK